MIGYALKKSVDIDSRIQELMIYKNYKEISVKEAIQKMESALLTSCKSGKIHDCSGECEGFSQYPQVYGAYPWSIGPGTRMLLTK